MEVLCLLSSPSAQAIVDAQLEKDSIKQIYFQNTASKSLEILTTQSNIEAIICDGSEEGNKFLNILNNVKTILPLILFGNRSSFTYPPATKLTILGFISPQNIEEQLQEILKKLIHNVRQNKIIRPPSQEKKEDVLSEPEGNFVKIKTELLFKINPPVTDVFIRLSPVKFLKLFKKGEIFQESDKQKVTGKNLDFLYLTREEAKFFLAAIQTLLAPPPIPPRPDENEKGEFNTRPLESASNEELQKQTEQSEAVHETVQELIHSLGPTPEVQGMIKSNIKATMHSMGQIPKLGKVLNLIANDNKNYVSSHSIYLCYISCAIAACADWTSDTTFQKLTLACFLHDITLRKNKLARYSNLDEILKKKINFTEEELYQFQSHPIDCSEIAKCFQQIPPDVDDIILQHHERPDGTGFPRGLKAKRIAPLACAFIIAHDLIDFIYENGANFSIKEFKSKKEHEFMLGNFKKIFENIDKLIINQ